MLMTPEPLRMLQWDDKRESDGGRRGRRKAMEFKRSRETARVNPEHVAMPRRFDAVHAPVYKRPVSSTPMRPGAEDFLNVASRGVNC